MESLTWSSLNTKPDIRRKRTLGFCDVGAPLGELELDYRNSPKVDLTQKPKMNFREKSDFLVNFGERILEIGEIVLKL